VCVCGGTIATTSTRLIIIYFSSFWVLAMWRPHEREREQSHSLRIQQQAMVIMQIRRKRTLNNDTYQIVARNK
jgi:hypothetical protein